MKIFDLHNDILTKTNNFSRKFSHFYSVACAIWRNENSWEKSFFIAKNFNLKKPNNLYLAFEDLGYNDLNMLELLSLNPLYCSLTYNGENQFGYGCDYNLPLKGKGLALAKVLYQNEIKIDVAHLSEQGVYSLLDLSVSPFCSHTGVKSLKQHKRNLSNQTLKALASGGGIVGVTPVSYFMPSSNLEGYFNAIDYAVNLIGINSVSIGTDFNGCDSFSGVKNYSSFIKLERLMLKNGYTKEDISKVFYLNAKRYFAKNC